MKTKLIRLPDDVHAKLVSSAAANERTEQSEILYALKFYLRHSPEVQPQGEAAKKQRREMK